MGEKKVKKRIMTAGIVSYDTCDRNDSVHKRQTIQQKQRKLQNQMGKKELEKIRMTKKIVMNAEQKKIYEKIKLTYKEEEQKKLRKIREKERVTGL